MVWPESGTPFYYGTILLVEVENGLVGNGHYNVVARRWYFDGLAMSWYGRDLGWAYSR